MAVFCHLLGFAGFVVPMGNLVGPLVLWLIKKDTMPFVDSQGKEALNFQITLMIAVVACVATSWLILPLILLFGIAIASIVLMIIAAIKAGEGIPYTYPFILRLVK